MYVLSLSEFVEVQLSFAFLEIVFTLKLDHIKFSSLLDILPIFKLVSYPTLPDGWPSVVNLPWI